MRRWLIVASAAAGAILVAALAFGQSRDQYPPVIQRVEDAPTPHPHNRFVSMDGTFFVLPWDDREISDEQKKADPIYNPAWVPFASCMETHGLAVRSSPGTKFSQADLDALVSRLNRENPDRAANLALPFKANGTVGGTVGAFLDCGEQWLTKTPQEIQTLTGVVEPTLPPSAPLPARTVVPPGR